MGARVRIGRDDTGSSRPWHLNTCVAQVPYQTLKERINFTFQLVGHLTALLSFIAILTGAIASLAITRAGIPGRRYDALVRSCPSCHS